MLGLFVLQVSILLKILPHVLQGAFKIQQGSRVQMFTKGSLHQHTYLYKHMLAVGFLYLFHIRSG